MRLDYFCPATVHDRKNMAMVKPRILRTLAGWRDADEDADFTTHMDGPLRARGLIGEPLTLVLGRDGMLEARISFHEAESLSESDLSELTEHVEGQLSDGYGEDGVEVKAGLKRWHVRFETEGLRGPVRTDAPKPERRIVKTFKSRSQTTLIDAVDQDDVDAIQTLLDDGADMDAKVGGFTPVMRAVTYKNQVALDYLLDAGANPDIGLEPGRTPLFDIESLEAVRALLKAGTDTTIRHDGLTAEQVLRDLSEQWADDDEDQADLFREAADLIAAHEASR